MPDNVGYTPGVGATVAADDIGGALHQRIKLVLGADGVSDGDVSSSNPLPVSGPLTNAQLRATALPTTPSDPSTAVSFGPVVAANTVLFAAIDTANENSVVLQLTGLWQGGINLQASQDGVNWVDAPGISQGNELGPVSTVYAADVVVVPHIARFFRAITTSDFVGSVSGSYTQRLFAVPPFYQKSVLQDVASDLQVPVAGFDPSGYRRPLALNESGHMVPADGRVVTGSRAGALAGTVLMTETTGYGSVILQLAGTWTGTLTFQVSNDSTTWTSVFGWAVSSGAVPTATATANGQWAIPAAGRFFRVQITTAGTGVVAAVVLLKNFSSWYPANAPSIAANAAVNVAQLAGTAPVTAGVAGTLAVGGNVAVGAAPTTNPISLAWDGTNTRRILTDAISGGVALGAAGVSNGASVSTLISAATNNLTQLKGTLGKVFIIDIQNTVASIRYLKLFNLPSASVTMGTTNATLNFSIPASGKLTIVTDLGINLGGTGISYALTGAAALNDNTAIGAGDLICNFQFV